jgi:hypothetical protein
MKYYCKQACDKPVRLSKSFAMASQRDRHGCSLLSPSDLK